MTAKCRCRFKAREELPQTDGKVRVRRETQGRGGKTVTTIAGVPLAAEALRELAGELKRLCGSGGATKDGVIEIQGDHCERVLAALTERGYRAIRAGG
jgi:translation initiation factor 1